MPRIASNPAWVPKDIDYEFIHALSSPAHLKKVGRWRTETEAMIHIGKSKDWVRSKPAQFREWLDTQKKLIFQDAIPGLIAVQKGIAMGYRAGSNSDKTRACDLILKWGDPTYRSGAKPEQRRDIAVIISAVEKAHDDYVKPSGEDIVISPDIALSEGDTSEENSVREVVGQSVADGTPLQDSAEGPPS